MSATDMCAINYIFGFKVCLCVYFYYYYFTVLI